MLIVGKDVVGRIDGVLMRRRRKVGDWDGEFEGRREVGLGRRECRKSGIGRCGVKGNQFYEIQ